MLTFPPKKFSPVLLDELSHAFEVVKQFGSIELYVQGGKVTQITARAIRKLDGDGKSSRQNSSGTVRK